MNNSNEKFCTKCGKKFIAVGREVICPDCKAAAAEDAKRAAVLKAKRASWAGESVPVRISGRASTVIRRYGAANSLPFAESLDVLLKSTDYFKSVGTKWEEVEPYKSRRRDKHATEDAQEVKAAGKPQEAPQASKPQEVTKAAKVAKTTSTASTNKSKASAKMKTSKAAGKATDASKKGERKA